MAWERRSNGRMYFYRSRRVNGHVVKEYYGNSSLAHLAAHQLAEEKRRRAADREAFRQGKDKLSKADDALDQLITTTHHMPIASLIPPCHNPPPEASMPPAVPTAAPNPLPRVRELLGLIHAGDRTALPELEQNLDQYPNLWVCLGDLGEQAIQAWIALIAGPDEFLAKATRQKLAALRTQLGTGINDAAARLLVDRVLATWLQVTYADTRYAQSYDASEAVLEFLARRQRQAQQQHLSALGAWRMWRRVLGGAQPTTVSPQTMPAATTRREMPAAESNDLDNWIHPFPGVGDPKPDRPESKAV